MGRPSKYPAEFRQEAVRLALVSDESRAGVARRLGIHETTLRNWVADHLAEEARGSDPLAIAMSEREELRQLRKEVDELRTEREILRKAAAYFAQETIRSAASGSSTSTEAPTASSGSVASFGVSRSGFYAWAARPPSARATRDRQLIAVILEIHERSRRTYGAPRVHAELRRLDQRCSRKRVARLMRSSGLVGVHARRRWRRGRPDVAPVPDL